MEKIKTNGGTSYHISLKNRGNIRKCNTRLRELEQEIIELETRITAVERLGHEWKKEKWKKK